MSTILEIENAIEQLMPQERAQLATWFSRKEAQDWDTQIETDAAVGKLDFLFREADGERETSRLKSWPTQK